MENVLTSVIIPAAGLGRRMKASVSKQYLQLNGKPVLAHTLDVFEKCSLIDEIVLVINPEEQQLCQDQVIGVYSYSKIKLVAGGDTRQESVYAGLKAVNPQTRIVLIHDGARPLIRESVICKSIEETIKHRATVVGVPAKNTIKVISDDGFVEATPDRNYLVEIQTPQTFDYDLIKEAHQKALESGVSGTDDAFLVEWLKVPVKIVVGDYTNIKITTPEDLTIAESIIKRMAENQ
ncbi:MAG: 2-C-methyl-D-erythritol 4-phosphate cytidylyltransferase [Acetobacterium sp. MES1]|uniref:2-C-methyl-D-erythritol 4-phosphate cytidylyltransferase n=1 Tax=Acetobacterium sp. MES1 TaxID=1899015 RepID=UPI000B9CFBB9|nr:2-C-methyl-D-erythritol 4-phosphate cytidylyltransferase [Acetobacterium sp. MES1]OXS27196.1 MAG: 2-C-methyl-D-erythritol 4-phosphate cytidylyltransferase [Acetobacterium sp. MES1]